MLADRIQAAFFGQLRRMARISICLHPNTQECCGRIVKAHSIQRRYLKRLAKNGRVLMMRSHFEDGRHIAKVNLRGVSEVTTFRGLCSYHDSKTFAPIESVEFSNFSEEHLFLYTYRAFLKEFHAKQEAVSLLNQIQPGFLYNTPLGHGYRLGLRDLVVYKRIFDEVLKDEEYDQFRLRCRSLNGTHPIAASAAMSIDYDFFGQRLFDTVTLTGRVPLLFLTLLPHQTSLSVLVAFCSDDAAVYSRLVDGLFSMTDDRLVDALSFWLATYAENWVASPDLLARWGESKKASLENYFRETINRGENYLEFIRRIGTLS